MEDIARWLANDAPHNGVKELFAAFCQQIVRSGMPVGRASLGLEVLHPEVSGWQYIWTDEGQSVHASDRATAPTSHTYLNSPTRIVDETGKPFRRVLDAPCLDLPLLEELRLKGMTDYVMYQLPFLDQSRTAVISFATRQSAVCDPASLDRLELAANLLSPYLERHVLHHIAVDLLDTYVGPNTGQLIIEGRVDRAAVELIEAAIWFADMRGFTLLSEQAPIPEVLAQLNAWFGIIGEVVEAHGGEILKFIGDSVLAIFPTSAGRDRSAACRQALSAAQEFCRRSDAENARRISSGMPPVAHGLALHAGAVAYGNVGASRRLDFTVIGPAVNKASRLLELAKRLDRIVLVSSAVAREVDQPLLDLGRYRLRDIKQIERVFTLP
ncbi:adenylate/guanylate cyclase domain-containing protein [Rhizobium leguminosarum]|uniref:Adenylate and Guanylate cyclase catalytic domain family protein n=2 Tax=Rhizobium leguminosarum TaxID=384 RepID=A0A2Z4YJB1_RHILE|nr:adenylate/guanylate cyclase domain-containing protein [Rhizobium leguminosarum]AXA41570.1 Adenylate and Guanylate cyclase catalytic domain family protein [Rhizobium leguminosarum]